MCVQFGDIAKLRKSITRPGNCAGQPYIGLEHITESSLSLNGIGIAQDVTSAKLKFYSGDILFGKLRPYFRKIIKAKFDGICSTDIWVVRAHGGNIDQNFLFYLMASDSFIDHVVQRSEGTRMPRAKWDVAEKLEFLLPPLPEQRRIAHILGTLDDKIENNRKTAKTLEAMAQAIFKSWFVDFDPVRAKMAGESPESICKRLKLTPEILDLFPDRLVDSELGKIPEGWSYSRLGDLADLNWGNTKVTKKSYVDHGYLAFSATGPDGFLPYYEYDHVGVVVSAIGANSGYTWLAFGKWSTIKNTIRFWADSADISTEYLYLATHNINFWPLRGSAQPFISQTDARNKTVLYPSKSLANLFGASASKLFQIAHQQENESQHLIYIRDVLLPKFISGEIRVPELDPSLEEGVG